MLRGKLLFFLIAGLGLVGILAWNVFGGLMDDHKLLGTELAGFIILSFVFFGTIAAILVVSFAEMLFHWLEKFADLRRSCGDSRTALKIYEFCLKLDDILLDNVFRRVIIMSKLSATFGELGKQRLSRQMSKEAEALQSAETLKTPALEKSAASSVNDAPDLVEQASEVPEQEQAWQTRSFQATAQLMQGTDQTQQQPEGRKQVLPQAKPSSTRHTLSQRQSSEAVLRLSSIAVADEPLEQPIPKPVYEDDHLNKRLYPPPTPLESREHRPNHSVSPKVANSWIYRYGFVTIFAMVASIYVLDGSIRGAVMVLFIGVILNAYWLHSNKI